MIKENKYKPFKEGDRVWLEGSHLKLPYATMKLAPRRYEPFNVIAKISNVAYRIQLPATWKIHDVFHASLLIPYNETNAHGPNFLEPPPDLIEGKPEWEVKMILGDRIYKKKKQYLIRWKGYAPAHDSWEDESGIHAPDLITKYKLWKLRNQSASQSSHQLAPAITPQSQSASTRRQNQARIRTLEVPPRKTNPPVNDSSLRPQHPRNHRSLGPSHPDPSTPTPGPQDTSCPPWKTTHRPRLEGLAETNISDWLYSIGLTGKQADQSQTPLLSLPSFEHTASSENNSETLHLDHSPTIIEQCHSPVSPGRTSQPVTRNVGSSVCSSPSKMNGTKLEQIKSLPLPLSTSLNGMKTTPYFYPPSTPKYTNEYSKTIHSASTTHNQQPSDGTKSWRKTLTFANDSTVGEMENPNYASTLQRLKKQSWQENVVAPSRKSDTDSAACATKWNSIALKKDYDYRKSSNSNSYTRLWTKPNVAWKQQPEEGVVLRSAVTMPTKNFFSLSLAPTRSSHCPTTGTSLNCTILNYPPSPILTCTSLNCNLALTPHDMPSGLAGGLGHLGQQPDDMPSSHPDTSDLLGYRPDDMPSGHPDYHLDLLGYQPDDMPSGHPEYHSEHLGHLGHLGYLGLLGHLGYLNILNPEPIDIPLHAFIQEEEDT
jgi:Chromo (CHRromatin Organisation MOdifier) domain